MDRRVVKKVTSAGTAYNLELGFKPHYVILRNETTHATVSKPQLAWWSQGQGDGYYKLIANQSSLSDGSIASSGTSNGFTPYEAEAFSDMQKLIDTGSSKVTKAVNAVVTSTAHGLSTGDKVSFNSILVGMNELNGLRSAITVIDANSFSCDSIDSTGFTTWDATEAYGLFIVISDLVNNAGFAGVTLGTAVVGDADDVLVVEAHWYDNFESVSA